MLPKDAAKPGNPSGIVSGTQSVALIASHIAWLKRCTAGMFGRTQGMPCTPKNIADQHFRRGEYAA
jgi:hypothetical protein